MLGYGSVLGIEKSICSHGRSYMFFIESIKMANKCAFWGHRWDRNERYQHTNSPEKADNVMAVYINEKQKLKSVLQFEIHF